MGSLNEQFNRRGAGLRIVDTLLRHGQRGNEESLFAFNVERDAAGGQYLEARACPEQCGKPAGIRIERCS